MSTPEQPQQPADVEAVEASTDPTADVAAAPEPVSPERKPGTVTPDQVRTQP